MASSNTPIDIVPSPEYAPPPIAVSENATATAPPPRRRTPLEVAEDELLEADDRVDEQDARVTNLESQLATAKNRRDELRRMRDYRAGHPLLDDTRNQRVIDLQVDAGYRVPDFEELPPVDVAFTASSDLTHFKSVQIVQARVPEVGDGVLVLVDDREVEGDVVGVTHHDDGRIDVDVAVPQVGIVRALLVTPTTEGGE